MSLSFVSSAILTSTDGVSHNEETEVSTKKVDSFRKNGGSCQKSLFEQLRSNQDEEDATRMESELSRIRGTLALNEDDVAHLNAVHQARLTVEQQRRLELEQETAQFRAHQQLRLSEQQHQELVVVEEEEKEKRFDPNHNLNKDLKSSSSRTITMMPKIMVKNKIEKKRKIVESNFANDLQSKKTFSILKDEKDTSMKDINANHEKNHGLENLLEAYGSSSEDEKD
jgi:FAM192A/Fyv6, N-terminal domain